MSKGFELRISESTIKINYEKKNKSKRSVK
jgi:hypothetical protein